MENPSQQVRNEIHEISILNNDTQFESVMLVTV